MKKVILSSILSLVGFFAMAQHNHQCGAMHYLEEQIKKHPEIVQHDKDMERKAQEWIKNHKDADERTTYRIPVVFHVVYKTAEENVADEYLHAQIEQLNLDFQGKNHNYGDVPDEFPKGHPNIEFCLAKVDPDGNPTTGITRTETRNTSFIGNGYVKKSFSGGVDPWDNKKYFNIWVCNFRAFDSGGQLLGYAQFPYTYVYEPKTDGLVLFYQTVGSIEKPSPHGFVGRTATHELGHCLGLFHIWGDDTNDDDTSDDCLGTDRIDDTPNQKGPSRGCPVHPTRSCGEVNMTMNYMDYSNDDCMAAFTVGQSLKMIANINNYSHLRSKVEAAASVCEAELTARIDTPASSGCSPFEVTFENKSYGGADKWEWFFPEGNPATYEGENPPTVTYTKAGEHEVKLQISNDSSMVETTTTINVVDCSTLECFSADNLNGGDLQLIANPADLNNVGGYVSGHNGYHSNGIAEHFTNIGLNSSVSGFDFSFAYAEGTGGEVEFVLWQSVEGKPDLVLASEVIPFETIKDDVANNRKTFVDFGGLQSVPDNFFIGVITKKGDHKFALHTNGDGQTNPSTAWILDRLYNWDSFDSAWGMNLSLAIYPRFCYPTNTREIAGLTGLELRPNPVSDILQIRFATEKTMNLQLEVYDMLGKKVMDTRSFKTTRHTTEDIDVSALTKGTYFVRLTNGKDAITTRFLRM